MPAEVTSIARVDGQYTVRVGDETSVTAPMMVIATGARYRRLELPRMEYFEKVSVYYAASQAEAQLCRRDPVVIFGGISVAPAKTFKFTDAELKAVHTEEWERTFSLFRLLI